MTFMVALLLTIVLAIILIPIFVLLLQSFLALTARRGDTVTPGPRPTYQAVTTTGIR